MKYMGSKRRIAKHILPIMLQHRIDGQTWVEPFVGGGNMIEKVSGARIGADINKWAIEGLISIRDHVDELPKSNKEFTEEDYNRLKIQDDYAHKGFAGFAYSFGATWLSSFRRDSIGARDYVAESYRDAVRQHKLIQGVDFRVCSYEKLNIQCQSLLYCDPPYRGVSGYKTEKFDHDKFWQWCRDMSEAGHTVFISEYSAPDDFECIWSMEVRSGLTVNGPQKRGIEKLFIHRHPGCLAHTSTSR